MTEKHIFIEQWKPKPAWLGKTVAERQDFADNVLGAIEAMKAMGVRALAWGLVDATIDHACPSFTFWAVWEMDSAMAVAGFQQGVASSGWYELFEQHNTTGVARTPGQVFELLVKR